MGAFISIITVSLNAAETIEDTIASVFFQDADFVIEHLIVDGGSRDATRQIIDRWASRTSRIRKIYEADGGIFDAMNKGLRAATGDYVLFLNADDFLVDHKVIAAAMGAYQAKDSGNPELVVGDVTMGNLGCRGFWRHRRVPRFIGRIRGIGIFPVHQGQFSQRLLLEKVGGFNSRLRLASDVVQYYELESKFRPSLKVVCLDISFMRSGGAANSGLGAMCIGTAEIYRELRRSHSIARCLFMVLVKTFQSLTELRYGLCRQQRWFL